jgi:AraC-like DNA-binding protein
LSCHAAWLWHRFNIRKIEDLGNAVFGAELEAIQMAGPRVRGSLAFAARDGIVFSSGLIDGRVAIRGPLSQDAMTLGVGLRFGPGSRYWLNEVADGNVCVVLAGDEFDAFYTAGSLYVTATLLPERLEKEAAREGLALDRSLLGRSGLHPQPIPSRSLVRLRREAARIHQSDKAANLQTDVGGALLRAVIEHYARMPSTGDGRTNPIGRARIVHRAREYIRENLGAPISLDALAKAAGTSRRTLYRAFSEVLEDTPQSYVRRLRLHRIRRELIAESEACRFSAIARHWGTGTDMGRLSGRYQDLFGEKPSATLALCDARQQAITWL